MVMSARCRRKDFSFCYETAAHRHCFQYIDNDINTSSKCSVYKHFINIRGLQPYLCKPILPSMRILISKIRLSSHTLCIETDIYTCIIREDRICHKCNLGVI